MITDRLLSMEAPKKGGPGGWGFLQASKETIEGRDIKKAKRNPAINRSCLYQNVSHDKVNAYLKIL